VLIADFYLIRKQKIVVDDLFTMSKTANYWYKNGYNPVAVGLDGGWRDPGHAACAARGHGLGNDRRVAVQLVHRLRGGVWPVLPDGHARRVEDDAAEGRGGGRLTRHA